jgi:hypothetical protein
VLENQNQEVDKECSCQILKSQEGLGEKMKEGMEKGQSLVMVKREKLVRVQERGSARRREKETQALLENTKNKNNSRSTRK